MSEPENAETMKKRSILVAGHSTSITLENGFWDELRTISERDGLSVNQIATRVDAVRMGRNLSSAMRLFILNDLRGR